MLKNLDNALMEMTTLDLTREMGINALEIYQRIDQNLDIFKEIVKRGGEQEIETAANFIVRPQD